MVDQSQGSKSARTADRQTDRQTDRVGNIMKAFCTSYSGFKKSQTKNGLIKESLISEIKMDGNCTKLLMIRWQTLSQR